MDITSYISKDGEYFFLDIEDATFDGIDYQDGDIIRWKWEGQKYIGTIREIGYKLFKLEKVRSV